MTVIGVDGHKRTHTLVAVDELGRHQDELTVAATPRGHDRALLWIGRFGPQVLVAVEDCRHLTRRFEADLLTAGHQVVRVHTRLMAGARRSARERGKSDPIDAQAVARAALREPDLPRAALEGPAREVKLLSDYRCQLVQQRTKVTNRLLWFLHELDPELGVPARGLKRIWVFDALELALSEHTGTVADIAGDLLADCRSLTRRIDDLQARLRTLVRRLAPGLLDIPGCGVLSAATVIAETAGAARFTSKAAYARFNGTAPIPVWSSNTVKVRLNRGGNRRINHALHMIAITQIGRGYTGADYYAKQIAAGKTPKEARRLLRRRVSDRVFTTLLAEERRQTPADHAHDPLRMAA